jgi:hypothetical protein
MTKPTKEEIAALERWRSALDDAERGLALARPSSVRYEVLDLVTVGWPWPTEEIMGERVIREIRKASRWVGRLFGSIGEGAGQ